jgi:hypothetical protein
LVLWQPSQGTVSLRTADFAVKQPPRGVILSEAKDLCHHKPRSFVAKNAPQDDTFYSFVVFCKRYRFASNERWLKMTWIGWGNLVW